VLKKKKYSSYLITDPMASSDKIKSQSVKLSHRKDDLMEKACFKAGFEQQESVPTYLEGLRQAKKKRKIERSKTKGKEWFNLPATEITEERKNDLMVIQMRKALDQKSFYKKRDLSVLPKYFQIGTVMDNSFDYYTARMPRKQRKSTLVEELLADAEFMRRSRTKYEQIKYEQERRGKWGGRGRAPVGDGNRGAVRGGARGAGRGRAPGGDRGGRRGGYKRPHIME
jgi:hypothetical protein